MKTADLPAIYESAELISSDGQKTTKSLIRWELRCLVLAAASGFAAWRVTSAHLDVSAGVGTVMLAGAIVLSSYRTLKNPERRWYEGRAGAESVKTLAWRYAVAGDPFPLDQTDDETDSRFLARLEEIVRALSEVGLAPVAGARTQLTDYLRLIRASSFDKRKAIYARDRLTDQAEWYGREAESNHVSAKRWVVAVVILYLLGFAAGILRFLNLIDFDLIGLAAAAGGAAIAWVQLNQHRTLEVSYALTEQELQIIRDRIGTVLAEHWALFVSDAEDAISREHTMWLARRGHPGLGRRGKA